MEKTRKVMRSLMSAKGSRFLALGLSVAMMSVPVMSYAEKSWGGG